MRDEEYGESEDELRCPECDSELDPEDGKCENELCAYYDEAPPAVEDDFWLRQEERKQLGIGS